MDGNFTNLLMIRSLIKVKIRPLMDGNSFKVSFKVKLFLFVKIRPLMDGN